MSNKAKRGRRKRDSTQPKIEKLKDRKKEAEGNLGELITDDQKKEIRRNKTVSASKKK